MIYDYLGTLIISFVYITFWFLVYLHFNFVNNWNIDKQIIQIGIFKTNVNYYIFDCCNIIS